MRKHAIKAFEIQYFIHKCPEIQHDKFQNYFCTVYCKVHLVNEKLITTTFMQCLLGDRPCAKGLRRIISFNPLPVRQVLLSSTLTNEEAEAQRGHRVGHTSREGWGEDPTQACSPPSWWALSAQDGAWGGGSRLRHRGHGNNDNMGESYLTRGLDLN